ncbi:MAG TPA: hypothetical protein VN326_01325 [Casimicrobiaceae bacterium]|jgi:hypothetical protein|nr:hypothetical protein [Casimicrobiaceae bacterium]
MTSSVTPQPEIDAGDDWLDAMLREAGREHRADYIADDGFSQRVMAQLPEPATAPAWRRPAVVLLWVLGAGALMFSLPGLFEQVFRGAVAVLAGHRLGLADVALALLLFSGAAAGTLVYAARSE